MNAQTHRMPPALRHGLYAETLLPNEDAAEFEQLRQSLVCEFVPKGALEHEIVGSMTRLIWRKQNLRQFRSNGDEDFF